MAFLFTLPEGKMDKRRIAYMRKIVEVFHEDVSTKVLKNS